jgi:glycosyltransferase involved in cell wall biosynthesis
MSSGSDEPSIRMLNLHIYPSHLTNESRILKESNSLVANNLVDQVIVAGFWKEGLKKEEEVSDHIRIKRIDSYFGKLDKFKFLNGVPFLIFYIKCFFLALRMKPAIVNSHTLTILPLCVMMKFFTGAKLIYDPHELETETHESKGVRRKVARVLERIFIGWANHVIVVSDSIKVWYVRAYGIKNIDVVKNIPSIKQDEVAAKNIKSQLAIPENEILFIYQGYLSVSRGVREIIGAFAASQKDKHVVFMGFGPLEQEIREVSGRESNIHYLPAAKPSEVLGFTKGADIGIHIIPNTCLNHYYCLPNKVFEYLMAGVPFVVSNFPDIRTEFESADVAWFVEPGGQSLQDLVRSITTSEFSRKKQNCLSSKNRWSWETQDMIYTRIYKRLSGQRR